MPGIRFSTMLSILAIAVSISTLAAAEQNGDRVQIGRDMVVQNGEKAGDVVCVGCSVIVRGQADGDVVAVGGSVVLEQGAQVRGGITTVLGNIRLQNGAGVGGDVVAVAGALRRDSQSTIGGGVTSLGGPGWSILIVVMPLLMLGGFIALIIWLIQRNRRTAPVAA